MTVVTEITPEDKVLNAEPKPKKKRAPKHDFKDGLGRVFAHRHSNGEGWVADSARVEESVYVHKTAQVHHSARVAGNVRVCNRASVGGTAELAGRVEICNGAFVGGTAVLNDTVKVKNSARVYSGYLSGSTMVLDESEIAASRAGQAFIRNTVIRGRSRVFDSPFIVDSSLDGMAYVGGNARLMAANINGYVSVGGNARVMNSAISQLSVYFRALNHGDEAANQANRLRIVDHAVIVNCDTIRGLISFGGHSQVVASRICFNPAHANDVFQRIDVDSQAVFVGLRIDSVTNFNLYNVSPSARPAMGSQPTAPVLRAVDARVLAPARRLMTAGV
jgi:carbonic anhydrase/acetyltransferase-like protein (isoleucine patch superfamily)